jgi:hypothetical protein
MDESTSQPIDSSGHCNGRCRPYVHASKLSPYSYGIPGVLCYEWLECQMTKFCSRLAKLAVVH